MGFGFNLIFFPFLLFFSICFLFLFLLSNNKKTHLKQLLYVLSFLLFLFVIILIIGKINQKKRVYPKDIPGKYKIDRSQFAGKNADWQYDHFKFEITEKDSFIFYVLNDNSKIVKTFRYKMQTNNGGIFYIHKPDSCYHVLEKQPTLYRNRFSYYYVFESYLYGNMFFRKKKWHERF